MLLLNAHPQWLVVPETKKREESRNKGGKERDGIPGKNFGGKKDDAR